MSEDLDLAELSRQWKEIDMPALDLAVHTGNIQSKAQTSLWFMWGLLLALAAIAATFGTIAVLGDRNAVSAAIAYGLGTVAFGAFLRRQRREIRAADALLAEGAPAQVLRARQKLLDAELHAWTSPSARVVKGGIMPLITLASLACWWTGLVPLPAPLLVVAMHVGMVVLERRRLPELRRLVEEVVGLLEELDEPGEDEA